LIAAKAPAHQQKEEKQKEHGITLQLVGISPILAMCNIIGRKTS
jgi:hypothetical protein